MAELGGFDPDPTLGTIPDPQPWLEFRTKLPTSQIRFVQLAHSAVQTLQHRNVALQTVRIGRNTVSFSGAVDLVVPYISTNIYCKSRNLPNTDMHNYSTDLR